MTTQHGATSLPTPSRHLSLLPAGQADSLQLTGEQSGGRTQRRGRAAVVVNSTKFAHPDGMSRLRIALEGEFARHGWDTPLWLPTTATTLGRAETRQAVAAGVDVVLATGGDGTIRAVAGELLGTGVALALLPAGTGNLLARNLGIPLNDVAAAVEAACSGHDATIDAGWLDVDRDGLGTDIEHHLFLVMAGAGFDAAMIAGAGEDMKRRLGHAAYVLSGVRALRGPRANISLRPDGEEAWTRAAHGVVVGNCGELTMGLNLLPAADPADGLLDGVVLLPHTPWQWARAAWSVLTREQAPQPLLPRLRARVLEVRSDIALPVQVDGDVVGEARRIRLAIQPAALLVRRPGAEATTADRHFSSDGTRTAELSLAS